MTGHGAAARRGRRREPRRLRCRSLAMRTWRAVEIACRNAAARRWPIQCRAVRCPRGKQVRASIVMPASRSRTVLGPSGSEPHNASMGAGGTGSSRAPSGRRSVRLPPGSRMTVNSGYGAPRTGFNVIPASRARAAPRGTARRRLRREATHRRTSRTVQVDPTGRGSVARAPPRSST